MSPQMQSQGMFATQATARTRLNGNTAFEFDRHRHYSFFRHTKHGKPRGAEPAFTEHCKSITFVKIDCLVIIDIYSEPNPWKFFIHCNFKTTIHQCLPCFLILKLFEHINSFDLDSAFIIKRFLGPVTPKFNITD